MIVKYVKKKEIEKAGYSFTQLVGTKADGTAYTKDFFANDEHLNGQLNEFAPGEFLLLSYDTTKYKNLENIKGADGFAEQSYSKPSGKPSSPSNESTFKTRGLDTNRSAAMYLANELVSKRVSAKLNLEDATCETLKTANVLLTYLLEGRNSIEESKVMSGLEVPDLEKEEG
ncbi:MAG: hypothetical protein ACERKJ_10965 [Candidatus Dadabacteria bacterium]